MIRTSYSTLGFMDRDVESALDAIAAAGFKQAEILGQEPHVAVPPTTDSSLAEFSRGLSSRHLLATVHAPLTTNVLGAPEEEWRREKVEVLASYLRFAAGIGAGEVVIHPVPNPIFVPNPSDPKLPKVIGDAVYRSLDDLVPVCEATGICILLENLPYECDYPFQSMKELRHLVESYAPDNVGLLIDTGHAFLAKQDPAEEIRFAGDRLCGTHLQDSDGLEDRHWLPGQGIIDWDAVRRSLSEVNYCGSWTFEVTTSQNSETPEELCRAALTVAEQWQTDPADGKQSRRHARQSTRPDSHENVSRPHS